MKRLSGRHGDPSWEDAVDARASGRAGDGAPDLTRRLVPRGSKRWHHLETTAAAAADAAQVLGADDGALLVDAAWLHDVGYHHPAAPTGFHPLDGAELVRDAGWAGRLAALVAHHSEARFMAAARGLGAAMDRWPRELGLVTDGLVYADMTSAPGGGRVGVRERLVDVRRRHGREASERAAARRLREPYLVLAAARVDIALLDGGHRAYPAFPARHSELQPDVVQHLVATHARRPTADVRAAVHASASLVGAATTASFSIITGEAHRLLESTAVR